MFTLLNTVDLNVFLGPKILLEHFCFYLERKYLGYHQHNYLVFDVLFSTNKTYWKLSGCTEGIIHKGMQKPKKYELILSLLYSEVIAAYRKTY
jgi:hypothetical protein